MHLRVTSDANSESGVGDVVLAISGATYRHFGPRNYGEGLKGLCVVLMCRDQALSFKQRIRLSRKDRKLYMDVMLSLDEMSRLTHQERTTNVAQRLMSEIPGVLSKYKAIDFNREAFVRDLQSWFTTYLPKGDAHPISVT